MCHEWGVARRFFLYLSTLSIAGGTGIVLFMVQHDFKPRCGAIQRGGTQPSLRVLSPIVIGVYS